MKMNLMKIMKLTLFFSYLQANPKVILSHFPNNNNKRQKTKRNVSGRVSPHDLWNKTWVGRVMQGEKLKDPNTKE